jgi:hypothetical protein
MKFVDCVLLELEFKLVSKHAHTRNAGVHVWIGCEIVRITVTCLNFGKNLHYGTKSPRIQSYFFISFSIDFDVFFVVVESC